MRNLRLIWVIASLILVSAGWSAGAEGDAVESDHWMVGSLNGQRTASLHEVLVRHLDGSRTTSTAMTMVIKRTLGSGETAHVFRIESSEHQEYDEDAHGVFTAFRLEHEQSGTRSAASGTIVRDAAGAPLRVHATMLHLGRSSDTDIPVQPGARFLSDRQLQEEMSRRELAVNQVLHVEGVFLLDDRVQVAQVTATYLGLGSHARREFDEITDLVPIPMHFAVDAKGELAKVKMDMGSFSFVFIPSDGPVEIDGGEIAVDALVTAKGPAPVQGPANRYRLPETVKLPEDAFQHLEAGVLHVSSVSRPSALGDPKPYLAPEARLELDDAPLRAWVATAAAGVEPRSAAAAEQLRLAVRTYLTGDLKVNNGTALETFRCRHADCTGHAALLCAALRISGIPARIELGVVWSPELGAWAGHAWNSAYIGGQWVHLDSAYPGHARSCYLKLASGSGEAAGATPMAALAMLSGSTVETLAPGAP
jgi:hypothetical protein